MFFVISFAKKKDAWDNLPLFATHCHESGNWRQSQCPSYSVYKDKLEQTPQEEMMMKDVQKLHYTRNVLITAEELHMRTEKTQKHIHQQLLLI